MSEQNADFSDYDERNSDEAKIREDFWVPCRLYAFLNSGWWYDFCYVIGFGLLCGGGGRSTV
jgi:hypothetical protein